MSSTYFNCLIIHLDGFPCLDEATDPGNDGSTLIVTGNK